MILTEEEIRACDDYEQLALAFWQPTPAITPDLQRRVRLMAERMAQLKPREAKAFLPAPPKTTPPLPPCPPKPKPKPKPAAKLSLPPGPDINLFKSLFQK